MKGTAWIFGNDVNTDNISPTRYEGDSTAAEMASHAFADVRPEFAPSFQAGDYVVAGYNFGCGSLRESAVRRFKGLHVGAIIARSFARGFMRNAVNMGVWLIVLGDSAFEVEEGDELDVDVRSGAVKNLRTGDSVQGKSFEGLSAAIVEAGGAPAYFKPMVVYPERPVSK